MIKKSNWTNDEDSKLIELFNLGYTSKEIGLELNRTKEAIQKRIQMLKKKEIISEKNRKLKQIECREIKKSINRESSKFLSNRATIKACISAYKNNSMGDLVLDRKKAKEQGLAFPIDIPGVSVNEEIRKFNKFEEKNGELDLINYVKGETERLREFQKEVRKGIEKISV
ncbi:hypothetical protein [Clostridium tertium]|jgi:biotin operon repressor|uniref:hypothetical protein n=1 Tax=Clostridium tertium TaxID=1559 RepID=UPI0024B3AD35|nr:hypothetical protein [Clostridium tertium]MBS6502474.1 hypothetical protein [Clostridium sp.]MDI9218177.1 hypothetical protein [Clostridium tertium]